MSLVYPHVSPRWDPPCPGDGGSAAGVPSLHRLCLSEWGEGRRTESLRPRGMAPTAHPTRNMTYRRVRQSSCGDENIIRETFRSSEK